MNNNMSVNDIIEIRIAGKDIRPENIKAGDIADILKSTENMIESCVIRDYPTIDKEKVVVGLINIKSSRSVGLEFSSQIPQIIIPIFQEIGQAVRTNEFSKLPSGSLDSLEELTSFTRKYRSTADFIVHNGQENVLATITSETKIKRRPSLTGETTIYGQVVRVGGRTPKVMIETIDGRTIYCDAQIDIATKLGEKLYRVVCLSGFAHWDAQSLAIEQFSITGITPYQEKPLVEAMDQLATLAGSYYADVDDVQKYISNIRGSGIESE